MFREYQGIGEEEKQAVMEVMDSGYLSGFVAGPPDQRDAPNGGPKVRVLEANWARRYGVKHAISFNSATSALLAACGAIGLEPGDHVICPPWTMSATVAAPKFYGAVIDFADIEEETYCIDPDIVADSFGAKAVIAVNLFGHPAQLEKLKTICQHRNMYLIEDSAQTPLASENGKIAGTVGDIGIYSLNRHKHIHCGEGGIAITDNDELARGMRSVRNHGIEPLGLNLRMTEIEAAIATVQLKNIDYHVRERRLFGECLSDGLKDFMDVPTIRDGCKHDYYFWISKAKLKRELKIPHIKGYIQPLHRMPQFVEDIPYCPVVDRMREETIGFETCKYAPLPEEIDQIIEAFRAAVR